MSHFADNIKEEMKMENRSIPDIQSSNLCSQTSKTFTSAIKKLHRYFSLNLFAIHHILTAVPRNCFQCLQQQNMKLHHLIPYAESRSTKSKQTKLLKSIY